MKRCILILVIIFSFLTLLLLFHKPLFISITQKKLAKTFPGSIITIGDCQWSPLGSIKFRDVVISRDQAYGFQMENIEIYYDVASLLEKNISKVALNNADVAITLSQKELLAFDKYLALEGDSKFTIERVALQNVHLKVKAEDMSLDGTISVSLSAKDQEIDLMDIKISSAQHQGILIQNAFMNVNVPANRRELSVSSIEYDRIKIVNMRSNVRLDHNNFIFNDLSARVFNGNIFGKVFLMAKTPFSYSAEFQFAKLDIEQIVDDFDLGGKFSMSGTLGGNLTVQGKDSEIDGLGGRFVMGQEGGNLIVKDTRFLEHIAKNSGKSLDILVESFKDYDYNTGVVGISLDGDNLLLDTHLDGVQGKRDLNIVVHDFGVHGISFQ